MREVDSRVEYAKRFARVVDYIDAHLDGTLELATLADVAHFSPFHFHRLFAAWMGETLGEYVRRRRIEVAATRLAAQPRVPVLDVALSVGFGSGEAFARAFKDRFGRSPSAWRRAPDRLPFSKPGQVDRNPDQAPFVGNVQHERHRHDEEFTMEVKPIERPPVRIAFVRYVGPYGPPLGTFWQKTVMPWIAREGLERRPMYCISHDNPGVTAPEKCRADAGVEVADDDVPNGAVRTMTIPGGRYATTRFQGTAATIAGAWEGMMREWLPASGMQLDTRPMFEYYGPGMTHDAVKGVFGCEITIPIAPL